jgi:phosphatidylserine decarboxylase
MVDGLTNLFVPVHREGHRYVAAAAVITLVLFLLSTSAGWLGAMITAWVAYFFRDPDRVVPLRSGLIVAPADGRIIAIESLVPVNELTLGTEPRTRVAIALSLLDVHVNRAPIAGTIRRSLYMPGAFITVTLDKASENNERRATIIATDLRVDDAGGGHVRSVELAVVQIAGLIGRRIVSFVTDGAAVGIGERIGMIRFGSRVDLYLPPGVGCLAAVGQRMVAGETVLADLSSAETAREARRI